LTISARASSRLAGPRRLLPRQSLRPVAAASYPRIPRFASLRPSGYGGRAV